MLILTVHRLSVFASVACVYGQCSIAACHRYNLPRRRYAFSRNCIGRLSALASLVTGSFDRSPGIYALPCIGGLFAWRCVLWVRGVIAVCFLDVVFFRSASVLLYPPGPRLNCPCSLGLHSCMTPFTVANCSVCVGMSLALNPACVNCAEDLQ